MSFFNPEIPVKEKVISKHPWEKYIKDAYSGTYKYGHNSAKNPVYPKKDKIPCPDRVKFTVIGNRISKEFIYCINLVKGLHKYREKNFDAPVIRGVTGVEWPKVWNDLKLQYGGLAFCLLSQVAVLINDQFLGGYKELKNLIDSKYIYYIRPDYYTEAIKQFSNYIKSSGRPCAYLHISVDDENIGTLIFMLYADLVPRTCENFLRLCTTHKGGYAGTPVHRIVKDCWIQCGGFGIKSTEMDCENFKVPHDRRGVLCMANAGRHIDCSTQFFVLLQPAPWMAHKYVAFGQLIEGEETLQKIENVPVWYESPTKQIIIFKAGVLNLECQDILINKGANKYIDGHIENLFTLGEMFYEALLEKVFLEVDFRKLQRLQDEMAGEGAELTPEEAAKNIHSTQRFMRKKEEIEKQIEKSQGPPMTAVHSGRATPAVDKGENNDFDVEEYEYEPEEYSYKHVSVAPSASIVVKPEKPFYIALTDVPYPGEVDSTYDLKKMLKGDYCLESDIDKHASKKRKPDESRFSFPSELFDMLFNKSPSIGSESQETLNSDDEKEIMKYLKNNADRVSFAGGIVKTMAKAGKLNLFENQRGSELITDEALRRFRLASVDYRTHREKKVSISFPTADKEVHKEIKRRQTGFVRPEDLARIRQLQKEMDEDDESDEDADDDEVDAYKPYTRQVSVVSPTPLLDTAEKEKQSKQRQTGFVRPDDLEKVQYFRKTSSETLLDREDSSDTHVRIAATAGGNEPASGGARKTRRPTTFVRPSDIHYDDDDDDDDDDDNKDYKDHSAFAFGDDEYERPSVLTRLLEDVAVEDGPGPTLKNYKPYSETHEKNTLFLTASPTTHLNTADDPREKFKQHVIPSTDGGKTIDQILNIQHGKKVVRKISSDYVKTIDHIEHKAESSIRSVEYAKTRPAMSVTEYQRKNQQYHEQLTKSKLALSNAEAAKEDVVTSADMNRFGA